LGDSVPVTVSVSIVLLLSVGVSVAIFKAHLKMCYKEYVHA